MNTRGTVEITRRADQLEEKFGDPYEVTNPVGFTPILAADERSEMFAEGEAVLDDYALNAEFVPAVHGGRLRRLDELVEVMRTVYRRDPSLGLGYGASSLIASVNVWTSGNPEQCQRVADLLLRNGKVAAAYHELAHGNDMASTELSATPHSSGWLLNGRKEVVTNIQRSDAIVLFGRTSPGNGSRNHSQLFVDKSRLPEGRISYLPRYGTVGLRGVQLGGAQFDDCPIDPNGLIGREGQGLETAMKSFQITRTTLPAMMTGILDSSLHTTMRHVSTRTLYGQAASELPHVRSVLATAFVDLLICEAFSLVTTRAIHVMPDESSVYSAAVKYAIAGALLRAEDRLSTVMGSEFFRRDGEQAVFQKLLRDLKPVGFGHAARAACQTTILPQLGVASRRQKPASDLPPELFQLAAEIPDVPFDQLTINSRGRDALGASLATLADVFAGEADAQLHAHITYFTDELADIRRAAGALGPHELTFTAQAHSYDLVARYVTVLVAVGCLWVWWHNRAGDDSFLADPTWLHAALTRLRSGWESPQASLPASMEQRLFEEMRERLEERRSFGLLRRQLSGV